MYAHWFMFTHLRNVHESLLKNVSFSSFHNSFYYFRPVLKIQKDKLFKYVDIVIIKANSLVSKPICK